MKKLLSLLGGMLLAAHSQAHVTIDPPAAQAGAYQKLTFRIGHGCEGSPTVKLTVHVPESIHGAKPMPKPGWKLDTRIMPLSQPYDSHGKTIREEVRDISWSGGELPDAYYDEFSIQAKLPDKPGKLYVLVNQVCSKGENNWVEVPAEGSQERLTFPAPALQVQPQTSGAHVH